jgi:hypothetical protein
MSQLLEEARKLYKDILEIENEIKNLEKEKNVKKNLAKKMVDEFIESQIAPVAESKGYGIYVGYENWIVSWDEYRMKTGSSFLSLKLPITRVYLYHGKERDKIFYILIDLRDKPDVKIVYLKPKLKRVSQKVYQILREPCELSLESSDSFKKLLEEYIEECEREPFVE